MTLNELVNKSAEIADGYFRELDSDIFYIGDEPEITHGEDYSGFINFTNGAIVCTSILFYQDMESCGKFPADNAGNYCKEHAGVLYKQMVGNFVFDYKKEIEQANLDSEKIISSGYNYISEQAEHNEKAKELLRAFEDYENNKDGCTAFAKLKLYFYNKYNFRCRSELTKSKNYGVRITACFNDDYEYGRESVGGWCPGVGDTNFYEKFISFNLNETDILKEIEKSVSKAVDTINTIKVEWHKIA